MMTAMSRPRLLVLSFSPISSDARVLKQVRYFVERYDVVTCGYGPAPEGVVRHIELPAGALNKLDGRLITAHAYRAAYARQAGVAAARKELRGLQVDAVLANDVDALPVALDLRPARGVHADLHEYFPRLHENDDRWRRRIGPYMAWLCRRTLPRVVSASTVSTGLADEYHRQFGVPIEVVTNATPYADLQPGEVGEPVRLVHSGTSHRARNIAALIEAVGRLPGFTLDLFLTPNDPANLREMANRAGTLDNVTLHDPVPYRELVLTLNRYDLGLHLLPPATFNSRWALPNKIFDYTQARLGVVVGPSPEMSAVVKAAGNGLVTGGYSADDLESALRGLSAADVADLKRASHEHARELAAENEVEKWGRMVARVLGAPA